MPSPSLATDAWIISKRPPTEKFQPLIAFSAEHGRLAVYLRLQRKESAAVVALDLFDETALTVESSNQGQSWFIKEARLLVRHSEIGRSYEALRHASTFAAVVARNDVPEEGRSTVYTLLRNAFAAFSGPTRPDVVHFKSLYRFARDEGYAVRQQWLPTLPAELQEQANYLLRTPLGEIAATAPDESTTALLQQRLEDYLRAYTDVLID